MQSLFPKVVKSTNVINGHKCNKGHKWGGEGFGGEKKIVESGVSKFYLTPLTV